MNYDANAFASKIRRFNAHHAIPIDGGHRFRIKKERSGSCVHKDTPVLRMLSDHGNLHSVAIDCELGVRQPLDEFRRSWLQIPCRDVFLDGSAPFRLWRRSRELARFTRTAQKPSTGSSADA